MTSPSDDDQVDELNMNITINGAKATTAELRRIGWALVNVATQVERAEQQGKQAIERPTEKEIGEARAAAQRVREALDSYRRAVGVVTNREMWPEECTLCGERRNSGCGGLWIDESTCELHRRARG